MNVRRIAAVLGLALTVSLAVAPAAHAVETGSYPGACQNDGHDIHIPLPNECRWIDVP